MFVSIDSIREKYGIKVNRSLFLWLSEFLKVLEKPIIPDILLRNSSINLLINLDIKGASDLYKKLLTSKECILEEICDKCVVQDARNTSASFVWHNRAIDDTYLRYVQF